MAVGSLPKVMVMVYVFPAWSCADPYSSMVPVPKKLSPLVCFVALSTMQMPSKNNLAVPATERLKSYSPDMSGFRYPLMSA